MLLARDAVADHIDIDTLLGAAAVAAWHFIHDYQRQRILTFLNPKRSARTAIHIIQCKSPSAPADVRQGLHDGQSAQLEFLPERSTDFIFAVIARNSLLPSLVLLSVRRGHRPRCPRDAGQDTFARLTAAPSRLSFFVYVSQLRHGDGILPWSACRCR